MEASQREDAATEIAFHLYQSGAAADEEKTIRLLELAGDLTRRAGAFREAEQHYRHAIELSDDNGQQGELLIKTAICVRTVQGTQAAILVNQKAADLLHAAGLHDRAGRPETEVARFLLELNLGVDADRYVAGLLESDRALSPVRRAGFHIARALARGLAERPFP